MGTPLITLARAQEQLFNVNPADVENGTLQDIIDAASATIELYCRRTFATQSWDEVYYGTGTPYLYVNNPPITSVTAVRTGQLACIYIQNNTPIPIQACLVNLDTTGLTLTVTNYGETTTQTFTWADYPTMTELAAAINDAGNGWVCTLPNQFASWATADIVPANEPAIGGFSARQLNVPILLHWWFVPYFKFTQDNKGEIWCPSGFNEGYQNWRIQYVGGFAYDEDAGGIQLPEIQQATAELVQLTYESRFSNPNAQTEAMGNQSWTKWAEASMKQLSLTSRNAINARKLFKVARYQ